MARWSCRQSEGDRRPWRSSAGRGRSPGTGAPDDAGAIHAPKPCGAASWSRTTSAKRRHRTAELEGGRQLAGRIGRGRTTRPGPPLLSDGNARRRSAHSGTFRVGARGPDSPGAVALWATPGAGPHSKPLGQLVHHPRLTGTSGMTSVSQSVSQNEAFSSWITGLRVRHALSSSAACSGPLSSQLLVPPIPRAR